MYTGIFPMFWKQPSLDVTSKDSSVSFLVWDCEATPVTGCVTLGKLLNLSVLLSILQKNGE